MTYRQLHTYGAGVLEKAGIDEAGLDAAILLEYICNTDRNTLLAHGEMEISEDTEQLYKNVIEKRSARIPLQHITGEQEFMGLRFKINGSTLIPRQDTEFVTEEAMKSLKDGMRLLDICTGSGCILLSLLKYSNECEGIGLDISKEALELARENAGLLGIKNAAFYESDLYDALETMDSENQSYRRFDMIISNPPYIESGEIPKLMPEVRDYEPVSALDGGEDGLYFYRKIVEKADRYLKRGGQIFFETGYNQGMAVKSILEKAGFTDIRVVKDYSGLDRVVCARRD